MDTEKGREAWDDRFAMFVGGAAALVIILAILAAAAMTIAIYQNPRIDAGGNPLEPIFSSRLMIAAARLAILALGVYIVVSILIHMRRGQWLTAAGPFKVSGAARSLSTTATERGGQIRVLVAKNAELQSTISNLTTELRTHERLLMQARERLAEEREKGS